jgi:hypothetical protein
MQCTEQLALRPSPHRNVDGLFNRTTNCGLANFKEYC